jgi:hypothetical protein
MITRRRGTSTLVLRHGRNARRLCIGAVSARLENGTLRVVHGACPNLLREAELYRYAPEEEARRTEEPLRSDNHAMDALRYLIATIDQRKLRRFARKQSAAAGETKPAGRPWLRLDNEALWTTMWTVGR